jgi:hypothetical protein
MADRSSKRKGNETEKRGKGGPDFNELAFNVVQQATGQVPKPEPPPEKNAAAVSLGRLGGMKGGDARAKSLSPEQKKAIAKKAAQARWKS